MILAIEPDDFASSAAAWSNFCRSAITTEAPSFARREAIAFPMDDGRLLFAVPFDHVTLLGTTDQDHRGSPDDVSATPQEIAGPLLFLASDLSAHVAGEVMAVDGGAAVLAPFPDVKFGPAASATP